MTSTYLESCLRLSNGILSVNGHSSNKSYLVAFKFNFLPHFLRGVVEVKASGPPVALTL